MESAEINTHRYDNGKIVVVDQLDEKVVETYAIGDGGEIASYGYSDSDDMKQSQARFAAKEYGLGYIKGRRK